MPKIPDTLRKDVTLFCTHLENKLLNIYNYESNQKDAIFFLFFFCGGAATQRGSWPPHS